MLDGIIVQTGSILFDRLLYFAFFIGALFAITYAATSVHFAIGSTGGYYDLAQKRKPLTIPYCIPWLGGALSMIDQHGLHSRLARMSQSMRPLRLKVGSTSIYLIYGPENLRQIFQNSKHLSIRERVLSLFESNRVPEADLDLLRSDKSGEQAQPNYEIESEKRIWRNGAVGFSSHLAAPSATKLLAEKFEQQLVGRLREKCSDDVWQPVALYKFLQQHMVYATGVALNGRVMFEQNPEFHKTIWKYDEIFLMLGLGLPRWIMPRLHRARDEMREALIKWYKAAYAKDDFSRSGDPDYEPVWGSRFWRHLVQNFLNAGMSLEGAAASSMTTQWAIHTNAIPGATWFLFEILTRPTLKDDIVAEIHTAMTDSSPPTFDSQKLLNLPILNSVWRECTRLRISTMVYRETDVDVSISNTTIPAGSMCMAPTWPAHTDSAKWGVHGDPPPLEFDPGRFLRLEEKRSKAGVPKVEKDCINTALNPNNLFPWGGGSHLCPGRFFAKQETFIAAALLLTGFDIEVVRWERHQSGWPDKQSQTRWTDWMADIARLGRPERPARGDDSYQSGGMMPPDRELRVRMKRKNWDGKPV